MVSCNDGAGADHLRQRELIYFYESSHTTDETYVSPRTCPAMVDAPLCNDPSASEKHNDDTASLSGYNGNHGASVVLSQANKAPPPTFTKDQKRLVIQAWKHIQAKIEEVRNRITLLYLRWSNQ